MVLSGTLLSSVLILFWDDDKEKCLNCRNYYSYIDGLCRHYARKGHCYKGLNAWNNNISANAAKEEATKAFPELSRKCNNFALY